jgi:hypothetical protein
VAKGLNLNCIRSPNPFMIKISQQVFREKNVSMIRLVIFKITFDANLKLPRVVIKY